MEIGVRLPLRFVTRIRDRRFVAKIQKEKVYDIEEKRMIGRIAALAAIAVLMGSSVVPDPIAMDSTDLFSAGGIHGVFGGGRMKSVAFWRRNKHAW